jgi:hypothetical protein
MEESMPQELVMERDKNKSLTARVGLLFSLLA